MAAPPQRAGPAFLETVLLEGPLDIGERGKDPLGLLGADFGNFAGLGVRSVRARPPVRGRITARVVGGRLILPFPRFLGRRLLPFPGVLALLIA